MKPEILDVYKEMENEKNWQIYGEYIFFASFKKPLQRIIEYLGQKVKLYCVFNIM